MTTVADRQLQVGVTSLPVGPAEVASAAFLTAMAGTVAPGPRVVTPVLVALGDSVSAGVGDAPADGGWVRHLAGLIGVRPVNLARNGARARDVLREQLPIALALAPPLVTVMVGGNDVLRGDFDVEEVRESVRATVSALTAAGSRVVLVVPPPVGRDLPAPDLVRRVLSRRTDAVRSAAFGVAAVVSRDRAVPVVVIDAADVRAAAGPQVFHIDRIHPSPLGHRELACQVATALAVRGWPTIGVLSPVPASPCLALKVAWLAFRGVPWLVRRSRDLLPELARIVIRERDGEPAASSGAKTVSTVGRSPVVGRPGSR